MPELADTARWWLAVTGLAVGALPLVLGRLLLRAILADTADPGRRPIVGAFERGFLQLALGLSVVAWLAVLLAELGQFTLGTLLAVGAFAGLGLRFALGPGHPHVRLIDAGATHALALGALCLLAGCLYLPPYPTVLWASDSTAYLNFGRQISESGGVIFTDRFLADIAPGSRAALFLNTTSLDVTGTYARFPGGFLIPDIAEPRVTAGFSPLFPVLVALFHQLAGLEGALLVGPLFAVLSVCALYFVGVRLGGTLTGVLAATLLAISAPQAWFAKFSLPAVVSQFFVLAGLFALLVALEQGRRRLAVAAGWLFGFAVLGKFDLITVLPVTAVSVMAVVALSAPHRSGRPEGAHHVSRAGTPFLATAVLLGLCVPLLHTAVHFLLFPSHYGPFVERMVQMSRLSSAGAAAAIGGLLVAGLGLGLIGRRGRAWVWHPARRGRVWACLVLLLLGVYGAGYLSVSQNRLRETTIWLGWYLSWPVLAVAAVGVASAVWDWWRGRANLALLVVVGLLTVAAGHYLYDPHEAADLIWSMRRFVPVVIPGLLLVVSFAVTHLPSALSGRLRVATTVVACACLVFLVGRPAAATFGERLWDGAIETSRQVAARFPDGAVVLVGSELAGIHLQTTLAYLHDVDTLFVQPQGARDSPALETEVLGWLRSGRPVFAVVDTNAPLFFAPGLLASGHSTLEVDLPVLETTTRRRPTAIVRRHARLQVLRLTEKEGTGETSVTSLEVGVPAEDRMFMLRGFHDAERDPDPDLGTYRWTGPVASFQVPREAAFQFVLGGGRSQDEPLAAISVWIDGQLAADGVEVPNAPTAITVTSPVPDGGRVANVTVFSTVFNPARLGRSADGRDLGVRLYRVDWFAEREAASVPLVRSEGLQAR